MYMLGLVIKAVIECNSDAMLRNFHFL